MHRRWIEAALLLSLAMTPIATIVARTILVGTISAGAILAALFATSFAGPAAAQQQEQKFAQQSSTAQEEPGSATAKPSRRRGNRPAPAFEHDPDLDAQDQLAPSQVQQQLPDAVAMPSGGGRGHTRAAAHGNDAAAEPSAAARPARVGKGNIIACSGVFAKDSSHSKLASAFQSRNVSNTQIDTNSGSKVTASVLYAKDPKRRLEVWWSKPDSKSDTHLIVINGQSDWMAPGELHLGLTLSELEKLNGKPFKLSGFDGNRVATLSDWDGGTLSALAGGCKVGISLRADAKAAAATLGGLPANRAFSSSDASVRAVNPTVSEILVAY
jgi:hypothetical protein